MPTALTKQEPLPFDFDDQFGPSTCGIDEAGRGPLCGPVVAACVHVPMEARSLPIWTHVTDSKKLSAARREALYPELLKLPHGIGQASVEEIDDINILHATMLAMQRAYGNLVIKGFSNLEKEKITKSPNHQITALIDGNRAPALPCQTQTVVKGDSLSPSIAAASILAKVTRDRLMMTLHEELPHYGWNKNAGYGTKTHIEAIRQHGFSIHHRKSFKVKL